EARGPAFGVSIGRVEVWRDFMEDHRINAYDLRTGRFLWRTSALKTGFPIWLNGRVFVSVGYDAGARAVRQFHRHGRKLPTYLEELSILPLRRLWRRRIPGAIRDIASIHRADP